MAFNLAKNEELCKKVEHLWAHREQTDILKILQEVLDALEKGHVRVVEPGSWHVYDWVKKAILLMFATFPTSRRLEHWCDRFGLIDPQDILAKGSRLVPGCFVRQGVFLDERVVVMPGAFVNIGAWIGPKTMIDSGTTIGSCAYIGADCHIASQVTIGGVLEPLNEKPVIIEEGCFIGAGCHIVEHVHIGQGSVLGAGVILGGSIKIFDRESHKVTYGMIPPGAVVVPGCHEGVSCAVIVKKVDKKTREKTSINEILRGI